MYSTIDEILKEVNLTWSDEDNAFVSPCGNHIFKAAFFKDVPFDEFKKWFQPQLLYKDVRASTFSNKFKTIYYFKSLKGNSDWSIESAMNEAWKTWNEFRDSL